MDTAAVNVTTTAKNLVSELALASGSKFFLTNTGGVAVYIAERTAAPTATAARHRIPPGDPFFFTVGTRGVWVWAKKTGEVTVSGF